MCPTWVTSIRGNSLVWDFRGVVCDVVIVYRCVGAAARFESELGVLGGQVDTNERVTQVGLLGCLLLFKRPRKSPLIVIGRHQSVRFQTKESLLHLPTRADVFVGCGSENVNGWCLCA